MPITRLSFIIMVSAAAWCGCYRDHHDPELQRVAELRPYTIPIRSIDPDDTVFTDLEPLTALFQDKTIVLLGEQSHGDGATFLAKTRLIKFLHQRMDFDVLAIESGLYECEMAERSMARGESALAAIRNSTFDIWTASRQFAPLMEYVAASRNTSRPLHYAGFDLQLTGLYGKDSLSPALRRFSAGLEPLNAGERFALMYVDSLTKNTRRFVTLPESIRNPFFTGMQSLERSALRSSAPDRAFWGQLIRSVETYARFLWYVDWNAPDPALINLRDKQMGDNLLWLSRVRYPGKKIVVWAASSHISRNRHEILHRKNSDTAMIPMGHHLWQAMGDSIYSIGCTAYEGTMGIRRRNGTVLAHAKAGSLEDLLSHTGNEFALLDFQHLPDEHWLRDTVRARPYGYATMTARWPRMLDGMLYIKSMTPSSEIETP